MTERSCGTCTACCEGWLRSEKLNLHIGHPCRHLTGQGCGIYPDRPEDPCVRFQCGWLQDAETYPDEMKPDRSGVIMLVDRTWRDWKVLMAIPTGKSVPENTLEWLRGLAESTRLPIIFYDRIESDGKFTGSRQLAFGSRRFADFVRYSIGPEDIVQM